MELLQENAAPMPDHMCGLPIPSERFGVCGLCGNGGEADTILLCDGPNCGKEFHMVWVDTIEILLRIFFWYTYIEI